MTENEIARAVVGIAFKIHKFYGPGLFESVYETIMAYELRKAGFQVAQQKAIPVIHEGVRMNIGFRADLIINDKIIVEVKSSETVAPVHKMQLLTYLRLADKRLGLLINFGQILIKDGISRVVNRLEE
jgi:GxxExxY protein